MLGMLKAKLLAGGVLLLSVLAFFFRFKQVKAQRDRAIVHKDIAEASVRRQKVNMEKEAKIDAQTVSRRVEILKEIENDEVPDNIANPNDF